MKIIEKNGNIEIFEINNFLLKDTLDCGQAFRWREINENLFEGVAHSKYLKIEFKDDHIILHNTSVKDFNEVWKNYFDLERNYEKIIETITAHPIIKDACTFTNGIRILNQEPWEALCSFIISQNNNIPRIKGIIERLCENFGEPNINGFYSFPTPKKVSSLSLEDLQIIRSGFRAKYILDAAKKVSEGEIDLNKLKILDTDSARAELMKIYGVGEKVADCTLLFGLGHINAFPKDVWIKKAMASLFNGELPSCTKGFEGIAQQYIFHYVRTANIEI